MSVFASHRRFAYGRFFGMCLMLAGVVLGTVYFGNVIRIPLTASVLDALSSPAASPISPQSTVFAEPIPFDAEGVIMTTLAGGEGIAVRLSGDRGYVQAYAVSGQMVSVTEGPVRIRGVVQAIDCSYANTLFDGQCTPTVLIESIEQLPIELQ